MTARTPAASVELPDLDELVGGPVRAGHDPRTPGGSAAASRRPASSGVIGTPAIEGELVQRTARATGESGAVQEDARTVDQTGLRLAVVVELADSACSTGVPVLPLLGRERPGHALGSSSVGLVGVVRPEGAAAVVGAVGIDALTAGSEDAGPARGEPGQVGSVDHVRIAGTALRVGELQPVPGAAQGHLGHGSRVGRASRRAVARVRAPADHASACGRSQVPVVVACPPVRRGPRCVLEGRCSPVGWPRGTAEGPGSSRRRRDAGRTPQPPDLSRPRAGRSVRDPGSDHGRCGRWGRRIPRCDRDPDCHRRRRPRRAARRLGALPASAARPRSQRPARRSTPRRRPGLRVRSPPAVDRKSQTPRLRAGAAPADQSGRGGRPTSVCRRDPVRRAQLRGVGAQRQARSEPLRDCSVRPRARRSEPPQTEASKRPSARSRRARG